MLANFSFGEESLWQKVIDIAKDRLFLFFLRRLLIHSSRLVVAISARLSLYACLLLSNWLSETWLYFGQLRTYSGLVLQKLRTAQVSLLLCFDWFSSLRLTAMLFLLLIGVCKSGHIRGDRICLWESLTSLHFSLKGILQHICEVGEVFLAA